MKNLSDLLKSHYFLLKLASFLMVISMGCQSSNEPSFGLIGDLPYSKSEEQGFEDLIKRINKQKLSFVVHVGDFKSQNQPCHDDVYQLRLKQFNQFSNPLIFIPGDNEWTDCHKPEISYSPLERLELLRKLFFPKGQSLGKTPLLLKRQSTEEHFSDFRENSRWSLAKVLFVSLHVVGSNNGFGRTPEEDQSFLKRQTANQKWLEQAFHDAKDKQYRALMLFIHGNPKFDLPSGHPDRQGFEDFLRNLETQMSEFDKPVVLVHGDTHYFRIDKPLRTTDTRRRIVNLTRVETFGVPDIHWLRVTIQSTNPNVFSFEPVLLENTVEYM